MQQVLGVPDHPQAGTNSRGPQLQAPQAGERGGDRAAAQAIELVLAMARLADQVLLPGEQREARSQRPSRRCTRPSCAHARLMNMRPTRAAPAVACAHRPPRPSVMWAWA